MYTKWLAWHVYVKVEKKCWTSPSDWRLWHLGTFARTNYSSVLFKLITVVLDPHLFASASLVLSHAVLPPRMQALSFGFRPHRTLSNLSLNLAVLTPPCHLILVRPRVGALGTIQAYLFFVHYIRRVLFWSTRSSRRQMLKNEKEERGRVACTWQRDLWMVVLFHTEKLYVLKVYIVLVVK